MTDKNKPTPKRLDLTPDEAKKVERAKMVHAERKARGIYSSPTDAIEQTLKSLTKTNDYEISTFYKPELVAKALNRLKIANKISYKTPQGNTKYIDQKAIKQKLTDNLDKLQAFYDKHQQDYLAESTRYHTLRYLLNRAGAEAPEPLEIKTLSEYFDEVNQTIKDQQGNDIQVKGYTVNDQQALHTAIKKLNLPTYTKYEIAPEPSGATDFMTFTANFKRLVDLATECGITTEGDTVMQVGDTVINQIHLQLGRIVNDTLAEIQKVTKPAPVARDKDTQLELFSNIKMGVDTAEIIARHQFFDPMYRGLRQMGEQNIYTEVTKANLNGRYEIAIPYETTGRNSVYKASMQLGVNISGVEVKPVTYLADAKRLQARLHKAHGMLNLWAMETNSNALYNVKMTDLLGLAGYEGRIKPDDYIDVTQGIIALVAQTITKSSETHYTDPKTGKAIRLGKNELYGEMIRPVGSLGAIWHMQPREYTEGTDDYNNLAREVKNSLEYKKTIKITKKIQTDGDKEKIEILHRKVYLNVIKKELIEKDNEKTETKQYELQPAYIKKITYARLAEGMLNPTQKRATIISKALLQLNTLQERYYLLMGVYIGETYSQHDKQTAQGKPIKLTVQTLLEWRGLNDPESLRRVDRTKSKLKDALDRLTEIGHIAKWQLKGGAKYANISLDPSGLNTVIEIYPPEHIQQVLRPAIADPNSKLTNLLKQDVREYGINKVAEMYKTKPEEIQAIVNHQDTVDSLPSVAYNDLKARQYDKNQSRGKS